MSHENLESREQKAFVEKRGYLPPRLVYYGAVRDLTQAGGSQSSEINGSGGCDNGNGKVRPSTCTSDRNAKENIICIDKHPFGIGLYLFDYKTEYRDAWGHGRQFGVMADEVETVMLEAVSVHPDGYKMVNYAMLGISRNLH